MLSEMREFKTYSEIDPSHEEQQYKVTHRVVLKVLTDNGVIPHLEKLGINTPFIAESIASESALSLHNGYIGDRRIYLKKLNSNEIKDRNEEIRNPERNVKDLMKKFGLSKAQIYRIRKS